MRGFATRRDVLVLHLRLKAAPSPHQPREAQTIDLNLRSTRDVARLFTNLGYRPVHPEVPDGTVATWHGFSVHAAVHSDPARHARDLTSRHLRPGRSLVAVLDPGRQLALAAPQLGRSSPSVLVVDLKEPGLGIPEHLKRFRPRKGMTGLALALRIDDLLAVQPVGKRFYSAFRLQHARMADAQPETMTDVERQLAALLPLLRVLFLYFVQAKGWLGRDHEFLRRQLDRALSLDIPFHRDVLNPLCFHTLNQPVARRNPEHGFSDVPYLNGGLFEAHPVERSGTAWLNNDHWRSAFDSVFERFRFCCGEGEAVDSIAPDMLGHVFERLMQPDDRQRSGSFYTPDSIVQDLVQASINNRISRLSGVAVDDLVSPDTLSPNNRRRVLSCLARLRVLDPAAGTGAFLMGALRHLTHLRTCFEGDRTSPVVIKKQILRASIFGVDINPLAVRLAELRLWLAVVADDPTTDPAQVEPLPNFDGVVMQGDSLVDPVGASHALLGNPALAPARLVRTVATARRKLFDVRGSAHREALRRLKRHEQKLATALLNEASRVVRQRLADLNAAAADRDLFGKTVGLTAAQRAERNRLCHQQQALDRLAETDMSGTLPFFSYEVHVSEVMRDGGFDVVVGNPPWVRAERIPPQARSMLKHRFTWWAPDTSGAATGYRHLPDLAVAFLERALELCRPGGSVGFLVPRKLLSASYAGAARASLVAETTLSYLHEVPAHQARLFAATTYPLGLVAEKTAPPAEHQVRVGFHERRTLPQAQLSGGGPWILISHAEHCALEEVQAAGTPLHTIGQPALGLKTGANDVFLVEAKRVRGGWQVLQDGQPVTLETNWVRPVSRGRDVRAFAVNARDHMLWPFTDTGTALGNPPPALRDHFLRHRARLINRRDYNGGPCWTVFRTGPATADHRVLWSDIARAPRAVFLDAHAPDAIPLNSCYVCPMPDADTAHAVAAMLNSTWVRVLCRSIAEEARGGYRRFNTRVMQAVPIPRPDQRDELIAFSQDAHVQRKADQQALDEIAAHALGLSPSTQRTLLRINHASR